MESQRSVESACSGVLWDEHAAGWHIAWRYGKPVSAFRFESPEVHSKRSFDDQERTPLWMWNAWVPDGDFSRLISWPQDTAIEDMKRDLIASDIRLQ